MSDRIFSLSRDGKLQRLERQRYADEGILQRLLAQYPDLLAGDEMSGEVPRRWLLVSRECGVPDEEVAPRDGPSIISSSIKMPCRRWLR